MDILKASNQEVLEEMRRVREFYTLKETLRYESKRDHSVHSESVAEHLTTMFLLVDYFLPLEDPKGILDKQRIHELILYHEIGEIETGDFISHKKTDALVEEERRAAARVAQRLPERIGKKAIERFREFDEATTPEAIFAEAIDKIEPIFEMLPQERWHYYHRHKMNKEMSVGKKFKAVEGFPYMRKFLDAWTEFMVANKVFVE